MPKILIIGGGFAGLWAALSAQREIEANGLEDKAHVTLISRDGYLTLRPRLYEQNPETLQTPLRPVLDTAGVTLIEATVTAIDSAKKKVTAKLPNGTDKAFSYDRLILAAGSELNALPIPGLAKHAFSIDTYGDAIAFDHHLQEVLEDPKVPGHNTFVIVGAGFTGIELVMEMRDRIAVHSDRNTADRARIVLIERAGVIGPDLGDNPRPVIEEALHSAGVDVRLGVEIAQVDRDAITLKNGDRLETATVVTTAGLRASPLAALLPVKRDELGRLLVDEALCVEGVSGVYASGDIAQATVDDDHLALMSCQHAMVMGKFAGYNAVHDLLDLPLVPYRQPNYVTCLDLGSWGAMLTSGWDRQVQKVGAEAKQLKQAINTQWIYPPQGSRSEILAAAALDARPGR